ncbi:MAG: FAD-dependent thymidylate synthase [Christensenellaceae bacterium]|jgi:thymidylate synthase (FAD)|nr:FAD-dependent thymidylate synthase [Christensenellaceae bacterium]
MPERKLHVRLLSATREPVRTVALGGRLCYSDVDVEQLYDDVLPGAEGFVDKLVELGHLSPIEHASFTFGAEGVSRALLAQVTRHRLASFSVQSQRYVTKHQLDYIIPPSIRALGEAAVLEYQADMQAEYAMYQKWLARGIPAEDARFVLPNAAETRMIITMNARELLHFFNLRCCRRAQWEIRRLAWCMLGIARREAPALFKLAGPPCAAGRCTEGKMSCGQQAAVHDLDAAFCAYIAGVPGDADICDWVIEHIKNQ